MMYSKAIVASAVVCLLASPTLAGEGRIPIFQPTALTGPGIDGKYILTRNVAAAGGGGPAIQVLGFGTEEVDIDLNGFTVFGDPAGGANVIEVTGVRTIQIHNGFVQSLAPPPGHGVFVLDSTRAIIKDLRLDGGDHGIFLDTVSNLTVQDNIINGATRGIRILSANTGLVDGNQVKDSESYGILTALSSGLIVSGNQVDGASVVGILIGSGDSCIVSGNTVTHAAAGISVGSRGCKVINNVTVSNTGDGIIIATDDTLVHDNVASNNQETGILVTGVRNEFEHNQTNANGCFGMWLNGSNSTFGRNVAQGNTTASAACAGVAQCFLAPVEACPAPLGGGSLAPDLCVSGASNISRCNNLMPGPPPS